MAASRLPRGRRGLKCRIRRSSASSRLVASREGGVD